MSTPPFNLPVAVGRVLVHGGVQDRIFRLRSRMCTMRPRTVGQAVVVNDALFLLQLLRGIIRTTSIDERGRRGVYADIDRSSWGVLGRSFHRNFCLQTYLDEL